MRSREFRAKRPLNDTPASTGRKESPRHFPPAPQVAAADKSGARPENKDKVVVVILPDHGDRYHSSHVREDSLFKETHYWKLPLRDVNQGPVRPARDDGAGGQLRQRAHACRRHHAKNQGF